MERRFISLLATGAILALALASGASAAPRVADHRALARSNPAAASGSGGGSLVAPLAACPQQEDLGASTEAQEQAMRCMTDFARTHAGLNTLADSQQLDLSAQQKSADLLQCDSFSHEACGRPFTYWMRQSGYISTPCWHVGENLAWGSGEYGTVRSIFRAWLRSSDHRRNILGDYEELGVDLLTGELEGRPGAHVWTEHFGSHCNPQQ